MRFITIFIFCCLFFSAKAQTIEELNSMTIVEFIDTVFIDKDEKNWSTRIYSNVKEQRLIFKTSIDDIFLIPNNPYGIGLGVATKKLVDEQVEPVFKNQRKNIIMFSFGYTYVPKGVAIHHHETDGIFVPSIGLDYKRRISEKWALSAFTDWELKQYLVWNREYDRNRAFIAVLGGSYEIGEGVGAFVGAGREFEKNLDLWVLRAGLEYGIDIGKHWVVVSSVFVDWKESYETYSFSLGISRKF